MCEMNIELSNLTASDCDDSRLISVAEFSLTAMGIHRESELSISLVDEDEMSALHIRWMDEPGALMSSLFLWMKSSPTPQIKAQGWWEMLFYVQIMQRGKQPRQVMDCRRS